MREKISMGVTIADCETLVRHLDVVVCRGGCATGSAIALQNIQYGIKAFIIPSLLIVACWGLALMGVVFGAIALKSERKNFAFCAILFCIVIAIAGTWLCNYYDAPFGGLH